MQYQGDYTCTLYIASVQVPSICIPSAQHDNWEKWQGRKQRPSTHSRFNNLHSTCAAAYKSQQLTNLTSIHKANKGQTLECRKTLQVCKQNKLAAVMYVGHVFWLRCAKAFSIEKLTINIASSRHSFLHHCHLDQLCTCLSHFTSNRCWWHQ